MAAIGTRSLPDLAAAWAAETFGMAGARPYIALGVQPSDAQPPGAHTSR